MKRAVLFLILILTGCVPMQSRVYPTSTPTPEMLIVRRSDPTPRANPTAVIPEVNYMATAMVMAPQVNAQKTAEAEVERQILSAVRQQQQYQQEQERKNYSCDIIGNVNGSSRIYHCPGWRDYNRISMNPDEGDRFFCSEAEARAAGFREPNYPHGACH